jgi:hypothetical protein
MKVSGQLHAHKTSLRRNNRQYPFYTFARDPLGTQWRKFHSHKANRIPIYWFFSFFQNCIIYRAYLKNLLSTPCSVHIKTFGSTNFVQKFVPKYFKTNNTQYFVRDHSIVEILLRATDIVRQTENRPIFYDKQRILCHFNSWIQIPPPDNSYSAPARTCQTIHLSKPPGPLTQVSKVA